MNALQAFKWTLRSVLFDKGPMLPAVLGIIFYCFFYPLPYLPQVVRAVPVVIADYDASSLSRKIQRDLDSTQTVQVQGVASNVGEAILPSVLAWQRRYRSASAARYRRCWTRAASAWAGRRSR